MTKTELQNEIYKLKEEIESFISEADKQDAEITKLQDQNENVGFDIEELTDNHLHIEESIKTMYMDNNPGESRRTITRLFFQSL